MMRSIGISLSVKMNVVILAVMLLIFIPGVSGKLAILEEVSLKEMVFNDSLTRWEYDDFKTSFIKDGKVLARSQWLVYKDGVLLPQISTGNLKYSWEIEKEAVCGGYQVTTYPNTTEQICQEQNTSYYPNGSSYVGCKNSITIQIPHEEKECAIWDYVDKQSVAILNQTISFSGATLTISTRTDEQQSKNLVRIDHDDSGMYQVAWRVTDVPKVSDNLLKFNTIEYSHYRIDWNDLKEHIEYAEFIDDTTLEVKLKTALNGQIYDPQMGGSGLENKLWRFYNGTVPLVGGDLRDETGNSDADLGIGVNVTNRGTNLTANDGDNWIDITGVSGQIWDWSSDIVNRTIVMEYIAPVGSTYGNDPALFISVVNAANFIGISVNATGALQYWGGGTCATPANRTTFKFDVDTGTRMFIGTVFDELNGRVTMYLNGTEIGAVSNYGNATACLPAAAMIGKFALLFDSAPGTYRKMMTWNRSLSASEMNTLYNNGSVLDWPLNVTTPPKNVTNITITKTDSPDPVNSSAFLNYSIFVNVTGNGTAYNVTVNDTYPAQIIFLSSQPTTLTGTNNSWVLGNLTVGTNFTINISLLTNNVSSQIVINNTANVSFQNETSQVFVNKLVTISTTLNGVPAGFPHQNYTLQNVTGNFTAKETQQTYYSINVTFNNTNVQQVNCTLDYAGLNVTPCALQSNGVNATGINVTIFNATVKAPIIVTNNTGFLVRLNFTFLYVNGQVHNVTVLNRTQNVTFAFNVISRTFTTNVTETEHYNFSINITKEFDLSDLNVTAIMNNSRKDLIERTGDTYNNSMKIPLISTNNTLVGFNYEVIRRYANGTVLSLNESQQNITVTFGYMVNIPYAAGMIEGATATITSNLTKLLNKTSKILLNVDYRMQNTSGTFSADYLFSELWSSQNTTGLNPDANTENLTANFTSYFTLNDSETKSQILRSNNGSHFIHTMILKICSDGERPITENISYFNIDTTAILNVTSTLRYTYYGEIIAKNRSSYFTYPLNFSNVICIKPINNTLSFFANLLLSANASGFVSVTFTESNESRSIVSDNHSIYLQSTATSQNLQNITIQAVDQDENPLAQHIIQAERYDAATNTYLLVASDSGDINGKVKFELATGSNQYRFTVIKPTGKVILQTITFKILETSYRFKVTLVSFDILQNILAFNRLNASLTFSNSTKITTFAWNDVLDNITSRVCLRLVKREPNASLTMFDECSGNDTGTFNINISQQGNGTFQAIGYGYTNNPSPYTIRILDILQPNVAGSLFAREGLFISFIIVLFMGGVALAGGPVVLIIVTLVSVGFIVATGVWSLSWGVLLGIIFAGIVLSIKEKA